MKRKPWFVCGSVSALAAALFIAVYAPGRMETRFDDAYMFSRYADNFLNGHGFAWNQNHGPSHGTTSPVYLFLITAFKAPPQLTNSLLLSFVSFSLFLLGVGLSIKTGFVLSRSMSRNGFSAERILMQEPDLIWMPHWDYVLFRSMLEQNESFRRDYLYYPGVFNYGIALRKGSPLFETILKELEAVFARAYPGEELGDYCASPEG